MRGAGRKPPAMPAPAAPAASTTRVWASLAAGGCAGVVTKTCVQPLERVKTILQIQGGGLQASGQRQYSGIAGTFLAVLREEGARALWKGNGANCARIVPAYAVRFACNDRIQQRIAGPGRSVRDLATSELVLAGTIAGVVQQVTCYPFETVKSRMALAHQTGQRYAGIVDCVRRTAAAEGWPAIYKGLSASVLYGGPYVGAQMTCYELYQRLFTAYVPGSTDPETGAPTTPSKLLAGAFTGVTAQSLVFPMQLVRTRLQVNGIGGRAKVYTGMADVIVKVFRHEGVRGFFKGCGANNLRMFPNGMIQFAAFDFFKKLFMGTP